MNKNLIINCAVAGCAAIVCSISAIIASRASKKVDAVCQKLGETCDTISKRAVIDVADEIIDNTVKDVAEEHFSKVVPKVVEKTARTMASQTESIMLRDLRSEVDKMMPKIADRLSIQANNYDIKDVIKVVKDELMAKTKRDVDDMVKDMGRYAEAKLDNQVDDICDKFRDKIDDKVDDFVEDARKEADKKFDKEIDGITSRYKNRLDDVGNIYQSLANKFMK